jgi:hypothetical protein
VNGCKETLLHSVWFLGNFTATNRVTAQYVLEKTDIVSVLADLSIYDINKEQVSLQLADICVWVTEQLISKLGKTLSQEHQKSFVNICANQLLKWDALNLHGLLITNLSQAVRIVDQDDADEVCEDVFTSELIEKLMIDLDGNSLTDYQCAMRVFSEMFRLSDCVTIECLKLDILERFNRVLGMFNNERLLEEALWTIGNIVGGC